MSIKARLAKLEGRAAALIDEQRRAAFAALSPTERLLRALQLLCVLPASLHESFRSMC